MARKPRSEEKRRRRRTRGEGDSTGLRRTNAYSRRLRRPPRRRRGASGPLAKDRPGAAGDPCLRGSLRARPSDEHYAASARGVSRRRGRGDARGVAVSGRTRGAPGGAALRHRHCSQCQRRVQGRHVLQTSPRCGGRAARSSALVVDSHGDGGAAGPFGLQRRAVSPTCTGPPARRAGLHGAVRAGSQRARGHAGRDRLARRRRTPLAVGIHHPGHDGLRDLPRPRIDRPRCWGPTPACSCATGGRRIAATPDCTNVSESLAPTLQAPPGGSSRQSLGRRGAGGPAGRPRPARPLQRGPPPLDDAERFAAHLANEFPAVFLFLPVARATNWRAEQAIVPWSSARCAKQPHPPRCRHPAGARQRRAHRPPTRPRPASADRRAVARP